MMRMEDLFRRNGWKQRNHDQYREKKIRREVYERV